MLLMHANNREGLNEAPTPATRRLAASRRAHRRHLCYRRSRDPEKMEFPDPVHRDPAI